MGVLILSSFFFTPGTRVPRSAHARQTAMSNSTNGAARGVGRKTVRPATPASSWKSRSSSDSQVGSRTASSNSPKGDIQDWHGIQDWHSTLFSTRRNAPQPHEKRPTCRSAGRTCSSGTRTPMCHPGISTLMGAMCWVATIASLCALHPPLHSTHLPSQGSAPAAGEEGSVPILNKGESHPQHSRCTDSRTTPGSV